MFKNIILLILALFLGSTDIFAQKGVKKYNSIKKKDQREYLEKTVVFKIKPDIRYHFNSEKEKLPAFNRVVKEIGLISIERMFPNHKEPEKKRNALGQEMADISLIYILKYGADISVEEASEIIMNTGLVEYAEPSYIDYLLVIPNDPYASPDSIHQAYFAHMQAFEAFDIEEGDTNVVIGIIDTGAEWFHEDLVDNIKYNYADPIDGIDNDGDGYIDNFRGWDLGNNDNNTNPGNNHGTTVSGCAAATTNNNKGVAGTGFKCKFLPLKASTDSPSSGIIQGYAGIIYAADHGCKVINLSWGGAGGFSSTGQDIVNYAAINNDVVVVAAAGNNLPDGLEQAFYPASYDNVLSVAGLDMMYNPTLDSSIEVKAFYATYHYTVDISAMGVNVYAPTGNTTEYGGATGSSFSSPLVAGAAGLVRSKYPLLNALQIAERLRVTADPLIDSVAENLHYKNEKMGKGRLNMYRALTDSTSPAIRMYEKVFFNNFGNYAFSDDTVKLKCSFRNFLAPSANAIVTLSTSSPNITVLKNTSTIGSLATLGTMDNTSDEFIFYVHPETTQSEKIFFRLGYEDAALNYNDYQYFEFSISPNILDIDTNEITLTVTENGRLGYTDGASTIGNGMIYKNESVLFEGGLMIGLSNTKVSDCVRGTPAGTTSFDFSKISSPKYITSAEGDQEIKVTFTDTSFFNPIKLKIEQRTYATENAPDNKYIIIEYDITNLSGSTISALYTGIFADWDIQNYNQNKSRWNTADSIGYTYFTGANGIHAGVCLLTNNVPSCYSMDHTTMAGNINPNDGFTTSEKYSTLSNGIARPDAGGSGLGFDVSQVVGGKLENILNNEKRTIAFALVAGDDVLDLKASARSAKNRFRSFNTSGIPAVSTLHFCGGDTITTTITPGNGTKFNFYESPGSTIPINSGNSHTVNNLYQSDTIYVRGADSLFESSAVPVYINLHTELLADFTFAPDTLILNQNSNVFLVDKSLNATYISWDLGDGNTSTSSAFLHQYTNPGIYNIRLIATDVYGCEDTLIKQLVVLSHPNGIISAVQDGIKIYPNPASDHINIELILSSVQDVSINIYNSLGEEIYAAEEGQIMLKNFQIQLSDKKTGMYYARIKIGNQVVTQKFIVQ